MNQPGTPGFAERASERRAVSVIIPARNEEHNIARCVRSAAAQNNVEEIIVVDDQSTDGTSEILGGLQKGVPALRVVRVDELPDGWLGKCYALATGAAAASGDWLLFTDADTEHLPGSLATLLARAETEGIDLLSVSPGQVTETWWEKAVIPRVYVELARRFRFEDVNAPASPAAAANGQYMLIRREVYERVGGHEAVRNEILEDVALARRVKLKGGRLLFLPGAPWVRTRMYRTFSEMWEGWTKNLYLLYERNLGKILGALAVAWFLDLAAPFVFIALGIWIVLGHASAFTVGAAAACLLATFTEHWRYGQALRSQGFDPRLAAYLLPGAALFAMLLLNSTGIHGWHGSVRWKGRRYSTTDRI